MRVPVQQRAAGCIAPLRLPPAGLPGSEEAPNLTTANLHIVFIVSCELPHHPCVCSIPYFVHRPAMVVPAKPVRVEVLRLSMRKRSTFEEAHPMTCTRQNGHTIRRLYMKVLQHTRGRAGDLGAVPSCPSSVPSERLGEVVTIADCYAGNRCDLQVLQREKTGVMQATVTAKRAFGFLDEKESVLWTSMPVLQEALGAVRF